MTEALTFRNPAGVAAPIGAYHHVAHVRAGTDLMFISGQVGSMPDGTLPASPEDQYAQALRNIVAIVAAEGGNSADIVKLDSYFVRPLDLDRVRGLRQSILGDVAPAATLIYVPRLASEEYLVEVQAIAIRR